MTSDTDLDVTPPATMRSMIPRHVRTPTAIKNDLQPSSSSSNRGSTPEPNSKMILRSATEQDRMKTPSPIPSLSSDNRDTPDPTSRIPRLRNAVEHHRAKTASPTLSVPVDMASGNTIPKFAPPTPKSETEADRTKRLNGIPSISPFGPSISPQPDQKTARPRSVVELREMETPSPASSSFISSPSSPLSAGSPGPSTNASPETLQYSLYKVSKYGQTCWPGKERPDTLVISRSGLVEKPLIDLGVPESVSVDSNSASEFELKAMIDRMSEPVADAETDPTKPFIASTPPTQPDKDEEIANLKHQITLLTRDARRQVELSILQERLKAKTQIDIKEAVIINLNNKISALAVKLKAERIEKEKKDATIAGLREENEDLKAKFDDKVELTALKGQVGFSLALERKDGEIKKVREMLGGRIENLKADLEGRENILKRLEGLDLGMAGLEPE